VVKEYNIKELKNPKQYNCKVYKKVLKDKKKVIQLNLQHGQKREKVNRTAKFKDKVLNMKVMKKYKTPWIGLK